MLTVLLLLGGILVLAVGVLIFQVCRAPVGDEDAEGFHFAPGYVPKRKSGAPLKAKVECTPAHAATFHISTTI